MGDVTTERKMSGRLALRFLARSDVQERLRRSHTPVGTPVVVCEWGASMKEVRSMLLAAKRGGDVPGVLILIREGDDVYLLAALKDADFVGDAIAENEVHDDSLVGHVYQALTPKKWGIEKGLDTDVHRFTMQDMKLELV
ncbi:hypothetical protein ACT3SZ_11960 [Corynebacterium sp. AOP40-9SA-29]|uniref:hypothetical protein n=1 Tax=Corynebacterium sp. AOP40-9SA-29 TaxID=3457677 RepID=UPI0040342A0D